MLTISHNERKQRSNDRHKSACITLKTSLESHIILWIDCSIEPGSTQGPFQHTLIFLKHIQLFKYMALQVYFCHQCMQDRLISTLHAALLLLYSCDGRWRSSLCLAVPTEMQTSLAQSSAMNLHDGVHTIHGTLEGLACPASYGLGFHLRTYKACVLWSVELFIFGTLLGHSLWSVLSTERLYP